MRTARSKTAGAETIALGSRKVTVTHPDRVLFPESALTKGDLCHYYRDVAHWLLPYLAERPLTLQRWPDGIDGFSFFEKQAPRGMPEWIARTEQPSGGKRAMTTYPVCNDAPSLVWFANLAAITLHTWMSRVQTIGSPDFLLLDLDPFVGCTVRTLAEVALIARDQMGTLGLEPLVKTTGGKGLHVVVPLTPRNSYDEVRDLAELLAQRIQREHPDLATIERMKAKRPPGTAYIDWAQAGLGKTIVPPYVVRGRPGAPVSMPLDWSEVEKLSSSRSTRPTEEYFRRWSVAAVPRLLAERGELWEKPFARGQRLDRAIEAARRSASTLEKNIKTSKMKRSG